MSDECSENCNPDASYNKGKIHYKEGEIQKALVSYTKAERDSPTGHPDASFYKGVIYYKEGEIQKALASYTKAEKSSPKGYPNASYNKGIVYQHMRQLDNALASFTKTERDSPEGYPKASLNKGNIYYEMGQLENALASYSKADRDSPQGYQDASHNKGLVYYKMCNLKNALASFTKAEEGSPKGYPNASIYKGLVYREIGELENALASYTKAEQDSPIGHPDASYNKGVLYYEEGAFQKALTSYNKAEQDSPIGHPDASYNKGRIYYEEREFQKALESYTKAEEDSPNGYPEASYSKGLIFYKEGQIQKALTSFTMAEQDSPTGHPEASYSKGLIYYKKGQIQKALTSYTKVEQDSTTGHSNASYNKGTIYYKEGEFQKALTSFTKAEQDSPVGHPNSSYNKGTIYYKVEKIQKALTSYTKAEQDSLTGHPQASYGKGIIYYDINLELSLPSFQRAVKDSKNNINARSHMWISKCHHIKGDYNLMEEHAYLALEQDCRDYQIVEHVHDYLGGSISQKIYSKRLNYLLLVFENLAETKYGADFEINQNLFQRAITKIIKPNSIDTLFLALLIKREVIFPVEITYKERLRLAYLIHFQKGDYDKVFQILDTRMDNLYGHEAIDHYFYCISAYLIGEPVSELRSLMEITEELENPRNKMLLEWSLKIKNAIQSKCHLDPYLLDVSLPNDVIGNDNMLSSNPHKWINPVLESIKDYSKPYEVPLNKNEVLGLLPQLLENFDTCEISKPIAKHKWKIIQKLLGDLSDNNDFIAIVIEIREGIQHGVPYSKILSKLLQMYRAEENNDIGKNLILLQATVLFSEQIDNRSEMPNNEKIVIEALKGLAVDGGFALLDITVFGLGTAISAMVSIAGLMKGKNRKEKSSRIFDSIISEIV
ncbi:tetratricopeptide repeat protein [Maribacter sp.]|nr:tetratricopeptide repeat protein [Maribacter sp.]